MYSLRTMLRVLAPYLVLPVLIMTVGMLIYSGGGPVWGVYVTIILAVLVALPGEARLERRRNSREPP